MRKTIFRYLAIPVMLFALLVVLGFNALVQLIKHVFGKIKNPAGLLGIAFGVTYLCLAGCTDKEVQTSTLVVKVGVNTTELVKKWDGNKIVLEKYRDMFAVDDHDRATLDGMISMGDMVRDELKNLTRVRGLPSVDTIRLIFIEADIAVKAGEVLYEKYKENISPQDKFRAKMFMVNWEMYRENTSLLTQESSESDRYKVARDIFSALLQITTQVVMPTLIASGKI